MFSRIVEDSKNIRTVDTTRAMMLAALFASLTAVGAFIRIPVPPVPFTMQTLFVFLSAGILGPYWGSLSQCLYLAVGLAGLPVFAGGGGIAYIFSPTFGYLLGYPVSALFMGLLIRRFVNYPQSKQQQDKKFEFIRFILIYAAGSIVIFAFGLTFLFFYAENLAGNFNSIIWAGFLIFIPPDIVKIVAAAWLTVRIRRLGIIRSL